MQSEIQFAGFGGQGIMLMGQILAQAAMNEGYEVVWIPSYGPEMRGGTANCHVNIRDIEVGSPMVTNPTVLVALNRPSLEKFEDDTVPGGLFCMDMKLHSDETQFVTSNYFQHIRIRNYPNYNTN